MPGLTQFSALTAMTVMLATPAAWAVPVFVTFQGTSSTAAGLTAQRDAFRVAIGGGSVAGANGSFGGVRREINWDGVPDARSDPNALPADFFNTTSARGAVFSTPGTGFLVSSNAGSAAPTLFGFGSDFQTFSAQRLFTAVNSNTTDVHFFVAGTNNAATVSAFGLIFTDVEVAGQTRLEFFDSAGVMIYSQDALVAGNQGLSFLGATVTGGAISRVRIVSGLNTIVANGVLGNGLDDVVVMDDFLYAEPAALSVPEPTGIALVGLGLMGAWLTSRRSRRAQR
jgi:PEP-CTERM motif